jgi:hypothetical protein
LKDAKRVIVSGNWGLTVYLHLDQIAAIIKSSAVAPDATVYGFPNGGFFIDIPNAAGVKTYGERMAATFAISNGSSGVDPACKAKARAVRGARMLVQGVGITMAGCAKGVRVRMMQPIVSLLVLPDQDHQDHHLHHWLIVLVMVLVHNLGR